MLCYIILTTLSTEFATGSNLSNVEQYQSVFDRILAPSTSNQTHIHSSSLNITSMNVSFIINECLKLVELIWLIFVRIIRNLRCLTRLLSESESSIYIIYVLNYCSYGLI